MCFISASTVTHKTNNRRIKQITVELYIDQIIKKLHDNNSDTKLNSREQTMDDHKFYYNFNTSDSLV